MHCWYRFRSFRGTTPREWVLRIRFKKFKFGTLVNATECVGGFMQVIKNIFTIRAPTITPVPIEYRIWFFI